LARGYLGVGAEVPDDPTSPPIYLAGYRVSAIVQVETHKTIVLGEDKPNPAVSTRVSVNDFV
jgi:hypothetical protein|tara:strand:- start:6852 stop:7037 length:186 start_codon:yes stop_codon:yes gene_type:complete